MSNFLDENPNLSLQNEQLQELKNKNEHQKSLFSFIQFLIAGMYALGYCFMGYVLTNNPNTHNVTLAITALIVPTIILLALLRSLFTKKEEKTPPSLILNIGKEIKEVIMAFIDKK